MALDALHRAIMSQRVNWVLDAGIRSFFDSVEHECLLRMVAHRIILRLIELWLRAGVLESGERQETDRGTAQPQKSAHRLAGVRNPDSTLSPANCTHHSHRAQARI